MDDKRFTVINDENINEIVNRKNSKTTKILINNATILFREFCAKSKMKNIEDMEKTEMDKMLGRFWPSVRTLKGNCFKKISFRSLRYGIATFCKESLKMDISSDSAFNRSNEIHAAVLPDLKKAGHGDTIHKVPLSREDIENI